MANLFVIGDTLPQVWEESVLRCWTEGDEVSTQYDKEGDPKSRDCTIMAVVRNPEQEPCIHRAFPGSLVDLEKYRLEVVDGVHDHWIKPEEGKWSYTYHKRLFAYPGKPVLRLTGSSAEFVHKEEDQIAEVVNQLVAAPHTRRAQAIVWVPHLDMRNEHSPCLQRIWFRIFGDELRMNAHMRSNDAFKASLMNMYVFIAIQKLVRDEFLKRTGKKLRLGAYTHIVDSFHIYGSYFKEFESGFLDSLKKRPDFKDRVWDSTSEFVQQSFESARAEIAAEKEAGR